jgi:hypothetical protein
VFAANAERLARRTASDEIDPRVCRPVDLADIAADHRPKFDVFDALCAIMKHGLNSVRIPFDHQIMTKASARQAKG